MRKVDENKKKSFLFSAKYQNHMKPAWVDQWMIIFVSAKGVILRTSI